MPQKRISLLLFFSIAFLFSCRGSQSNDQGLLIVNRPMLTDRTEHVMKKVGLSPKKFSLQLQKYLSQHGKFSWTKSKKKNLKAYGLGIDVGLQVLPPIVDKKKKIKVFQQRWQVTYQLQPIQEDRDILTIQEFAHVTFSRKSPMDKKKFIKVIDVLWKEGQKSLAAYGRLYGAKEKELLQSLNSKDRTTRRHAIQLAGQRKLKKAVPGIIQRLKEKDPQIILAAIGALARLKDERAVMPLIQMTKRAHAPFLAQVISVLGEIGGEAAKSYLFALSSAHQSPIIRRNAEEALNELRQRKKSPK